MEGPAWRWAPPAMHRIGMPGRWAPGLAACVGWASPAPAPGVHSSRTGDCRQEAQTRQTPAASLPTQRQTYQQWQQAPSPCESPTPTMPHAHMQQHLPNKSHSNSPPPRSPCWCGPGPPRSGAAGRSSCNAGKGGDKKHVQVSVSAGPHIDGGQKRWRLVRAALRAHAPAALL